MKPTYYFILISIVLQLLNQPISTRVVQVIQVARHGARYPSFFPNGGIDFSNATSSLKLGGQLAKQGKNMHYRLGQQLKNLYWNDLFGSTPYNSTYNQSKFYIRSTNYNRTIESAQCQIMGWLQGLDSYSLQPSQYSNSLPPWGPLNRTAPGPNTTWDIFPNAPTYHPTPVHIQGYGANIYYKGQFLLSTDWANCPFQQRWQQQNYASALGQLVQNNPDVVAAKLKLEQAIGQSIYMWDIYKYVDNYLALKNLGLQYLSIFDDPAYHDTFSTYYLNLVFIDIISFLFRNIYTQVQLKTASTDFLKQIAARMNRAVTNLDEVEQVILYIGHDSSVSTIMGAFDYFDGECVYNKFINRNANLTYDFTLKSQKCNQQITGFASNVVFELVQLSSIYYVNVLFNGVQINLPFCSGSNCTLTNFNSWLNNFVVADPQSLCGIVVSENPIYKVLVIMLSLLIASLFILALFIRFKVIENKIDRNQYSQNIEIREMEAN